MIKAITITQENKDKNPKYLGTSAIGHIKIFSTMPKVWRTENWTKEAFDLATDFHEEAGFYEVVNPFYDPNTQKLGALFFDVNQFTYPIIALTQQEIQDRAISNSEAQRQQLIDDIVRQKNETEIITEAQASDDTASLDNQVLFPLWEYPFEYTIGFKCQSFNADNELKLYKCVQAHTSQSDWQPKDVPALFTVVAYPGEIPVWVQPTGAQDAYNTGDQVHFPTINDPVYESLIDANVWSPTGYPAGWQLI